ncbi:hypothetical protein XCR1_4230004 [Xenorhabdus cabanillasii JM26]|uniref:Uncharacterized protein n=1 Tax=Xenorhabdus cabanillasii JM26 TaxID=1427517 RepID=W1JAP4_9GAMM|nr:hypothetical protein XCR1_4230004 [Xenorhabdus cabanillasii JM26]
MRNNIMICNNLDDKGTNLKFIQPQSFHKKNRIFKNISFEGRTVFEATIYFTVLC